MFVLTRGCLYACPHVRHVITFSILCSASEGHADDSDAAWIALGALVLRMLGFALLLVGCVAAFALFRGRTGLAPMFDRF